MCLSVVVVLVNTMSHVEESNEQTVINLATQDEVKQKDNIINTMLVDPQFYETVLNIIKFKYRKLFTAI